MEVNRILFVVLKALKNSTLKTKPQHVFDETMLRITHILLCEKMLSKRTNRSLTQNLQSELTILGHIATSSFSSEAPHW